MIKISKRLSSLVKYIMPEDAIMDVGCDHALLDIYLVQAGLQSKIYVGDVNPNALRNGRENIEKYELSNNIIPVLSYGIEKINEFSIDTVVISGMGSKNIVEILSSPNLDRVYKLVLQSNNNHYELRDFLMKSNFTIIAEEIVPDGKKTYINIVAIRTDRPPVYDESEKEFGPILTKNVENLAYFTKLLETYEDIYYASKSDKAKKNLDNLRKIIETLNSN